MNSFIVVQFIYKMKSSVVALFSVNLMYSVNFVSVKVMLHCILINYEYTENLPKHTNGNMAWRGM